MTTFLKSMDNKTWRAIVKGWTPPVVKTTGESSTTTIEYKKEEDWTKEEEEEAWANSKALNAIFNGVDKNMFRLINTRVVAKEAWEILKTAHEGTSRVRMSRLQMLTTQFETLRMGEDQTIAEFHMQIRDIANSSLPRRFAMKVTAIEEAQDIGNMQVDDLIGSLQTFELSLNDKADKKNKSIAFMSNIDEGDDESESDYAGEFTEALALLSRKFNRAFKKFDRRTRPNVTDKLSDNVKKFDNSRNTSFQRKFKDDEKQSRAKGIQCHECEGYGHIKSECPTYLKKQKKGLMVTWSDDDSDDASEDITANMVKALAVKFDDVNVDDGTESDGEEMSDEELAETYKLLFIKWEKLCGICEKQKKIIYTLTTENTRLKGMSSCHEHEGVIQTLQREKLKLQVEVDELLEEVSLLKSKLEGLNKSFRLLNNGTEVLDHILEENKKNKSRKGIGFDNKTMNGEDQN